MLIKISNDLKKQEIWAQGTELASIMGHDRQNGKRVLTFPETKKQLVHVFKNPKLITDNHQIAKLPVTKRDTLFSLFNCKPRTVEYDNVSVYWNESHVNVWCPSIDTILFAKALKKIQKKLKHVRSAIEIGCGSGYLSKYLLEKNKQIESLIVNDINPYAIKCASDNIKDKRALFINGSGLLTMKNKKFDLIICNPPYVPRPSSIHDNPYEGIELLKYFLQHGHEHLNPGGILITNISSLCKHLVINKKMPRKIKLLDKMTVPLKVNNILNNPSWVKYLSKYCGMKKKMINGYEYYQTIEIVIIQN